MPHILVVDDDVELSQMLAQYLARESFETTLASDGNAGLALARAGTADAIILDIMMHGMDGVEVLRQIRETSYIPIIMLTAKGQDEDRIRGLELGADDYITKPFNPRELVARVKAVFRRLSFAYQTPRGNILTGDLLISATRREAKWKGRRFDLTGAEFNVLEALVRSGESVMTRDDICKIVLGRRHHPYDRSVDVHVSNLRRKIAAVCDGKLEIEAVRGRGYRVRVTE